MSLAVYLAGDRLVITVRDGITVRNALSVFDTLRETAVQEADARTVEIDLCVPLTAAAVDVLVQLRTALERYGKALTVTGQHASTPRVLRLFGLDLSRWI